MPNKDETTTKFKVDISELVKGMQQAKRQISLANAEFKTATAGMENWSKSADGVTAKLNQLDKNLIQQEKILGNLEEQYELTAKQMGEDSKQAELLKIRIENQKATIEKTKQQIDGYTKSLNEIKSKSAESNSAVGKLTDTINDQEAELDDLKKKYSNVILEQGENSKSAKELAGKIQELSGELKENKSQLEAADKAGDKLDATFDDLGDSSENASDGFTVMKGAIADLIADGIKKLADAVKNQLVEAMTSQDQAFNNFQAQTGASTKEMASFRKEIKQLYADNYGESLEDVAEIMGRVKEQFETTDPSVLSDITKKAIILRDTFDSDVNETLRGANNLMRHFGMDADEAFDFIAKGSQNGLDYTDELGDNIAEYGGNFKQAGYSAKEYFQLLENGVKGGAYNLDKVNDSINEVKNRLADGTIEGSLKNFDNSTQLAFRNWQKGKGQMKDVINAIVKNITNCESETQALSLAATAFGTMGEDANLNVVKSLTTLGDSYDDVKGTMEEIDKIKYDDVKNQFAQIGRTLQMQVITPLAQKAIPTVQKFTDYCINNMNKVANSIKIVGATVVTAFVVDKVASFTSLILKLIGTLATLKGATEGAAVAQKMLNLAQASNVVGALVVGLTALAGILAVVAYNSKENKKDWSALTKEEQSNKDSVEDLKKSYDELKKSKDETVNSTLKEYDHYQQLVDELAKIVDKNGKVKKGYEERAKFITSTLSDATGQEIKIVKGVVKNYDKLGDSIKNLIALKKAESVLDANKDAYTEAIKNQTTAFNNLTEAKEKHKTTEKELTKAKEDAAKKETALRIAREQSGTELASGRKKISEASKALEEANSKVEGLTKKEKEQKKTLTDAQNTWTDYNSTIQNYEGLSSAIISKDQDKIKNALDKVVNNFITAKTGTKEQLQQQVDNLKKYEEDMKKSLKEGAPGVTQTIVDNASKMVSKAEKELEKATTKAAKKGKKAGKNYSDGLKSTAGEATDSGKEVSNAADKGLTSSKAKNKGKKTGDDYNKGLASTKGKAESTATNIVVGVENNLAKINTYPTGVNALRGFSQAIADGKNDLYSQVHTLANNLASSFNKGLDIHSPSKKTEKSGKFFVEGFAQGIKKQMNSAEKAIKELADAGLKQLLNANSDFESTGEKVTSNIEKGIEKQTNKVKKAINKLMDSAVANAKKHVKGDKAKKALSDAGKSMADSLTSSFEKNANKAIKKSMTKLETITSNYQSKFDAINDKKSSLNESLSGYGDLFTTDDNGNVVLSNLQQQTADIKAFGTNLEKLKGKISSSLMDEILELDAENGAKFAQALISLTPEQLAAYNNAYNEKNKAASQISTAFYSKQLEELKNNYTKKIEDEVAKLKKKIKTIGEQSAQGFVDGLNSKKANKAVKQWSKNIVDAIKKELKIHSPSRVFKNDIAGNSVQGFIDGFADRTRQAVDAVRTFTKTSLAGATDAMNAGTITAPAGGVTNNYTFNQTNNSPKSLSRLEIYRQTRNQLNFMKGI
ncbi:phage tail tape measure protein [Eubacterium ventriosum]|uniref:phage tail tape measure protein n=1 Tax=Eubacterium ventriosum TaxID=39496 RepID=UPI00265E6359|nr:phage tail tape measure protein [Eubacterium ventriosum]